MFGARVAALRLQAGMTQAELAKRLAVSPSAVGMYEQGRREPSMDRIVALARLFGVSTDYLMTGEIRSDADKAAVRRVYTLMREQAEREVRVRRADGTLSTLTPEELAMAFAALLG